MPVVAENLLVAITGLALLYYMGGGLSRWLPAELLPYRWLIAPWAGYSLLVITTQFLTNEPFGLTALTSAYVALGVATLLWVPAVIGRFSGKRAPESENAGLSPVWWLVLALSAGVFVLCVLPLWSYGYTTVIGENWDAEIYLGLGEYLKVYPQSGLSTALPNPILDTLINPPYSLRTHGFSYFQAALGVLPLDSLHTLAPALALLRALSIPAVFVFFRVGLRLKPGASLLACATLGINAFLLWITFNMFGMQVPTFGLLPLSICALLVALRVSDPSSGQSLVRASLWAGLLIAATAVTYHPALTALVAMAAPVVAVLLVRYRHEDIVKRLVRPLLLALVTAVSLSLVSQIKSVGGFLKQYSEKTGGLGLTGFTSPSDAFGLSLSFRDLLGADPGRPLLSALASIYAVAGWAALALCTGLVVLYMVRVWLRRERKDGNIEGWVIPALLTGAIVYPLLFVSPLGYPYGWFKALSFVSFALVGAAVGGLWEILGTHTQRAWARRGALACGAVLAGIMLVTVWLTVGRYWGEPLRFDRAMLEVGAVRNVIVNTQGKAPGVYVSNSPNMQRLGRLYNGLLSYFLRDTDLYGKLDTANSTLNRERGDGLYEYSLLGADDSPSEYGVSGGRLVWSNSLVSLYSLQASGQRLDLFHHNYKGESNYPVVSAGKPLVMDVRANRITRAPDAHAPTPGEVTPTQVGAARQATLGLSAFTTATLSIEVLAAPGVSQVVSTTMVSVPPGYTAYRSASLMGTEVVRLSVIPGGASDRVYIRWAHLETYKGLSGQEPGLASDGPGLLARVSAVQSNAEIVMGVDYLDNRPGAVSQTLSLDIYGSGRGGSAVHYGYWNFSVGAGAPLKAALRLDPVRKSLAIEGVTASALGASFAGATGDGRYTASLLVYENGHVSETFNDLFTFEISGGRLMSFKPRSLPPQFR